MFDGELTECPHLPLKLMAGSPIANPKLAADIAAPVKLTRRSLLPLTFDVRPQY